MSDALSGQCPICIEDYDTSTHARLACPHRGCDYSCCVRCMQRHSLTSPSCPACRRALSLPWLVAHLDPKFMSRDFKRARRRQLVQQQLPLLRALKRCRRCLQPVHTGSCDSLDASTARTLLQTCRECPGCAALVEKVDDGACDVMHCTRCRTSFRYRDGTVVSNALHNPDQDAALEHDVGQLPRRDVPCAHVLLEPCILAPELDDAVLALVNALQTEVNHSFATSTNAFSVLRRHFEQGKLSEKRWAGLMYRRELANARNHEMAMLCSVTLETLMTLLVNHNYQVGQIPQMPQLPDLGGPVALAVLVQMVVLPLTLLQLRAARTLFNTRMRHLAGLYGAPTFLHIDRGLRLQYRRGD